MNALNAITRRARSSAAIRLVRSQIENVRLERSLRAEPCCVEPDFVGVGVQKAGTTWFLGLLLEVEAARLGRRGRKEIHFFDRYGTGNIPNDLPLRYRREFAAGTVPTGEWTPRYLHDPWALELIRQCAPNAQIFVILRDPVSRSESALSYSALRHGSISASTVSEAIQRSRYGEQLERLISIFPRDQLHVWQLEQMRSRPQVALREALAALGLEDVDLSAIEPDRRVNAPKRAPFVLSGPARAEIQQATTDALPLISELCSSFDPSLWSR